MLSSSSSPPDETEMMDVDPQPNQVLMRVLMQDVSFITVFTLAQCAPVKTRVPLFLTRKSEGK